MGRSTASYFIQIIWSALLIGSNLRRFRHSRYQPSLDRPRRDGHFAMKDGHEDGSNYAPAEHLKGDG